MSMPEDSERSKSLRKYVEGVLKSGDIDPLKHGELLLFGEAVRQFADNELGDDGLRSLIIHTNIAFMSDISPEIVKGIYSVYGVDNVIVDRLLDLDDTLDVDVGTTDYDNY